MDKDGLNTLRYKIQTRQNLDLYTEIGVSVEMTEGEKEWTSLKELKMQNITNSIRWWIARLKEDRPPITRYTWTKVGTLLSIPP